MSHLEALRSAIRTITGHKLRSILTTLGIIIGVAAVIIMVSIGQGVSHEVSSTFEGLGSHLITITGGRGVTLTIDHVVELEQRVPTLSAVAPSLSTRQSIRHGTVQHETTVEGTSALYPDIRNHFPVTGRFISEHDVSSRSRVVVLGHTAARELFGQHPAVGQTVSIQGQSFTVIGVMESKGAMMGQDQDNTAFIPISTAGRLLGTRRVGAIYARTLSADDARLAVGHIEAVFAHLIRSDNAVRVLSQDDVLTAIADMSLTLTVMLASLAGISLLVGGIGIMNIMLVSVTERIREIGIRKALGATRRDILVQFLVESMVLSGIGGALGTLAGAGIARLVGSYAGWPTLISPSLVMLAVSFACAVGLFFGSYPAARAAAADPVRCLRSE